MSDELTSAVGTVLTRKTLLVYGKGFHSASWSEQWRHQSGATSPTVSGHLSTCFTRVWPSCLGVKLHPLRPASSRNFRNLTVKRLLLPWSITVRVHPFHVFNPTSLHSPSTPLWLKVLSNVPIFVHVTEKSAELSSIELMAMQMAPTPQPIRTLAALVAKQGSRDIRLAKRYETWMPLRL